MGEQSKLLLPWNGQTVMDQVLRAWTESRASRVIVVLRRRDVTLQKVCQRWMPIDVVTAEQDPEDMKRSIQLGLGFIAQRFEPAGSDRWMAAPADLPTLSSRLIDQVIEASRDSDQIVAPRFGKSNGHPVSFPWSLVPEVFQLGRDQGINRLVDRHSAQWLQLPASQHPRDIDTPDDYSRISGEQEIQ
jgi:CTP:molybdopterin cytidylyltransferase MocA